MTVPQESNRYAPPAAHVDDVAADTDGFELASRGVRFVAAMIDGLLIMAALWLVGVVTPWNIFKLAAMPGLGPQLLGAVLGLGVFLLFNGYLLAQRGQTIGKMLTKVRIARLDGSRAPIGRLVLRYGVGYLLAPIRWLQMTYSLVDGLLIFGGPRRCAHDWIAGTIVVKA